LVSVFKKEAEPDKQVLAQPEIRGILDRSLQRALRQGVRNITADLQLLIQPWGFPVENIEVPAYFWHGLQDITVPPVMSEFLASRIPNSHLSFVPDEGHVSLVVHTKARVLETMIGSD
jgi:pimeloyl-ACP methyl ester carboxylesterase